MLSSPRRRFLQSAAVAVGLGLAGCAGLGVSSKDVTPTPSVEISDTTTDSPTPSCKPVETGFEIPELKKPASMSNASSIDIAYRMEREYQQSIHILVEALPGIPDDVGPYDYELKKSLGTSVKTGTGYRVELKALVGYTIKETQDDGTVTEVSYDKPVIVAVYTVSRRRVQRVEGVGELQGPLICW